MRFDEFDVNLVRVIVGELGPSFYTGQVSGDDRMQRHHSVSRMSGRERDTYLRMTGRFLSLNRAELGVRLESDSKLVGVVAGRRWCTDGRLRRRLADDRAARRGTVSTDSRQHLHV
jgi:hypothetical protein